MSKPIRPSQLSDKKKWSILQDYTGGMKTPEVAKKYNMTLFNMEKFISKTIKAANITRETNALVINQIMTKPEEGAVSPQVKYNDPSLINEDFLDLLSLEADLQMNDAEKTYCLIYSQTGNNHKACIAAGFDAGIKTNERVQTTVKHALMLRGYYLRNRPSIAKSIQALQEDNLKTLNISKGYVQTSLIQNIEELKDEVIDNPRCRGHLLKSIEMLGKTIGAFQDNIRIEQVDVDGALNTLIDLAKNEQGDYEPKH